MNHDYDVTIVSIFGRGHWLAAELAEKGKKVALIDISQTQGRWAPEDWEGPFGFFQSMQLSASQAERLFEDDYHETVEDGFVVWLKDGPYDLKGPMASFWSEQLHLNEGAGEYLSNYDQLDLETKRKSKNKIYQQPFEKSWFTHLCHQLASNVFKENAEGICYGRPLSVMSPLHIRRVSRHGSEKCHSWCESKGVTVSRDAIIKDIQLEKKQITAIEVESKGSIVIKSKNYVWGLSSEETYRLPVNIAQTLYPNGYVGSQWSWVRFRVGLSPTPAVSILPLKFVLIKDLFHAWTHENLCLIEKTAQENVFDVWVRISTQQRFQKQYLDQINNKIISLLAERIPESKPENVNMPQDYYYDSTELGPSRFPVYSEGELKKLVSLNSSNLYFDGPEKWPSLDWICQLKKQKEIFQKIIVQQRDELDK